MEAPAQLPRSDPPQTQLPQVEAQVAEVACPPACAIVGHVLQPSQEGGLLMDSSQPRAQAVAHKDCSRLVEGAFGGGSTFGCVIFVDFYILWGGY